MGGGFLKERFLVRGDFRGILLIKMCKIGVLQYLVFYMLKII